MGKVLASAQKISFLSNPAISWPVPPKEVLEFFYDKTPTAWRVGQRVRCLATRFNNEEPRADGKHFSDHHFIQTADVCVPTLCNGRRLLSRPVSEKAAC
jgi:hypothetical protein